MFALILILLPLCAAGTVWLRGRDNRNFCLWTLCIVSVLHLVLTAATWKYADPCRCLGAWLGLDGLARIFLAVTSTLFCGAAWYIRRWLPEELDQHAAEGGKPGEFLRTHIFIACLLAFLGTMTLVLSARNFGLLWVAVEATTLASAPLILFHRSPHSLEAMWKYLLICSVGIGLALFGTMLLAVADRSGSALDISAMSAVSETLDPRWFKAAFIFLLAGYGTKMGLVPFHTWLPDAHSEAPGAVSALLSGSLLNCSFFGIVRVLECAPDALMPFCRTLLIALGLCSLAAAAFFVIRQGDFKRMLAYSSVEHMGLIAILWCLFPGVAIIHLCGHSLIKLALFLTAGNLLFAARTRNVAQVSGIFGTLPKNAAVWIIGIMMICGMPPSPLFFTELSLITGCSAGLGIAIVVLLFGVFAGMTCNALKMVMGAPSEFAPERRRAAETFCRIPGIALGIAIVAGIVLTASLLEDF